MSITLGISYLFFNPLFVCRLDGAYGGVCLLRSICEISQKPFQNSNIFSEIVNAVLVYVTFYLEWLSYEL